MLSLCRQTDGWMNVRMDQHMGTFWLICQNLYWVYFLGTFQTFLGTKKVFPNLGTAKKPEDVRNLGVLRARTCHIRIMIILIIIVF